MVDAVIQPTFTYGKRGVKIVTWAGLDGDDTGAPFDLSDYPDKTVHIKGTFDTTTVTMQGSNDAATYTALVDPQGNSIAKTAEAIETILENPQFIRPSVSGGAGSAITVIVTGKKDT